MNKSKFLKRSLAALLAILMVATMIPSAFAAEGDPVHQDLKITVDTYSATQTENGDYTVTIWDSNDVTINWASIPGTTVTLVTGGKNPGVRLGLPQTLFLAENATIEGEDVYSVTLMEKVGSAEEVPHKLTITVESTIPDWNANLSTVRVDKTSGEYDIGYLTGNKLAGYDVKTKNNKMEAHAIQGEVDNDAETVTITLPFGMTPAQAGFGDGNISTPALVFAAESVHAKVAVTGDAAKNRITGVTVTAMDGTQKNFKVVYKQEKIFESFTGETNLSDLEKVPDSGDLSELDVELTAGSADFDNYFDYARNTGKWVPEFATTDNVQRIMGTSGNAEDVAVTDPNLNYDNSGTDGRGEFFVDNASPTVGNNGVADKFLKLITSNHASWGLNSGDEDVVYLLVRTKANPLGAFVQVNLKAVTPAPAKAYITEVQTEDTQSVYDIDKDTRNITLTVDNTYTFKLGATPDNIDINDKAAHMTLHINTDAPSTIDLPQLESGAANNTDGKWWEDGSSTSTHHIIKGVMGKSGSVLVRVYSADKSYIDYTINFTTASSNSLGLKQIELRKKDGTHIQSAVVDSDDKHTFYLKVPYSYHAGKPVTADIAGDLLACQLLVFPDAGAVVKPGSEAEGQTPGDAFENSITTVGKVWLDGYTNNASTGVTASDISAFEDTLYLTVSNGDNGDVQVYQLILQREKPLEEAEITAVTANKALDDDYIFSVASTLGTQVGNTKDVGQAYAGAIDKDGNELPATVDETTKTIKIQVPYDWDNDSDTLYLTGITKEGYSFHRVQNTVVAGGTITPANKLNNSLESFVLNTIEQEDQTNKSGADTWMVGFTNLTTSPNTTEDENILYVFSEKDRFPNVDAAMITPTVGDIKDKATKAYKVYIEKVGNANTGNALSGVSATGATASFNSNLGLISVSVPGSYNWTSYRADNSKDFKLTFSTSTGALVIDRKKYLDNEDVSGYKTGYNSGALTANDGKYIESMTGVADNDAAKADAKVYLEQLNEFYDLNDAIFFVKNGELYTYDELSGKETQVTGLGGRFTNSNWGAIKTKQAEIRVYREDQSSFRNYRLDLKVGEPSSAKDITSLKVGDVTAAKNGSSFTANLPEEAEKEQALTIEASPLASVMVNGEPYQADRLIDVSKEVTIVVTAENGSTATYTLTTTFGNTPPGPGTWTNPFTDVKEGDWYYNAVKYANENGLMDGTSATKFSPRVNLTRAQFAQILYNAEGNPDVTWTDKFSDVKEGAWYAKAVIWAAENNVLAGYANGTARPNSIVTREDLVSLLWRYAGKPAPTGTTLDFSDASKVSSYAKDALLWAVENKIISGRANGELDPKGNAQRAEAAQMLMQYFSNK